MPRFSANLSLLFTERPLLERFAAARDAGFEAIERYGPERWFPAFEEKTMRFKDLEHRLGSDIPDDALAFWNINLFYKTGIAPATVISAPEV
ncbi:hypothetical protein SAMN04488125_10174 [Methylorubrum salsuginis]|uniref:Hydroxypyruvate isomerase n=1 Tax=Methylorubrum salsuginis TaxID=414703 RepID=A0A1I3Y746_9HYPH|nr:hypothetical protein SAMN04488125_10174 [Methylorubrum salsuginis]